MEVKFSDELAQQINTLSGVVSPDNTVSESIDFDAKGTVHVMRRNQDGKLLQDVPIKELQHDTKLKSSYNELIEEWREKQVRNEAMRKREKVLYACLIALCFIVLACVLSIK